MKGNAHSLIAAGVATVIAVCVSSNASASGVCAFKDFQLKREIASLEASVGQRVIAIGRVDSVSQARGVGVLGFVVRPSASDVFQIGDYAAVVDWSRGVDKQILEIRPLAARYVPGASEVFLKSKLKTSFSNGQVRLGAVNVDVSRQIRSLENQKVSAGATIAVRGIQPNPGGVVLGGCISAVDGSMGIGRLNGSMGTGRTDGSMGTGRTDGSMGTGWLNGSMGTGRTDGSMGTGRLNGSMGTGKTDGSMGTGRTEGSMGTGRTDGSMGTGRTDGSMGTGRLNGSMGTGRTDGSTGTGRSL